jgi:cell division protease FtsH
LYGGRIAEELIYGVEGVTTGASNDIERATSIARNMVTKWGLSSRMGPLAYSEDEGEVFLGRSVTQHKHVSDETAHAIDGEIREVIDRNYNRSKQILTDKMSILHAMAQALMKYETIDRGQVDALMRGEVPPPPADWNDDDSSSGGRGASPKTPPSSDKSSGSDDGVIGGAASSH